VTMTMVGMTLSGQDGRRCFRSSLLLLYGSPDRALDLPSVNGSSGVLIGAVRSVDVAEAVGLEVLTRSMSSSNEPTGVSAGHTLTRAPTGACHRPCAR